MMCGFLLSFICKNSIYTNAATDPPLIPWSFQMVQLPNWLPDSLSQAQGMELEKVSFLGPFMGLSPFAEDSVSFLCFDFLSGKRLRCELLF